ncbi:MAG: alpha/beta fold hydrolase [Gracilimonas sp.]|nr:alpha/beta fold hydrolase [Gracilimonas sp.]
MEHACAHHCGFSVYKVSEPPHQRIEIATPDEDFLEIDVCEFPTDKPVVALFHGLEGSTDRHYIANLMGELKEAGFPSVALNFRGCGSRLNEQPRFYHSGATDDYRTLFNWIRERFPDKEIYAVGYSLGANALVKYLGEEGSQSLVKRAVAVSPPYDLKEGSLRMQMGINKFYEKRFLITLADKLEMKREKYPDMPIYNGSSIYEFDDQVTAALHGFAGADDYSLSAQARHFSVRSEVGLIGSSQQSRYSVPNRICPQKTIRKIQPYKPCLRKRGVMLVF